MSLEGKRLLVLGSSVGAVSIVKSAQKMGVYVLVTDYLPIDRSPAKQIADEVADVSTLDVDALCALAAEKKIDGVISGVSEPNLLSVYKVCERLGFPCYFTQKQWDLVENKKNFRQLCMKYGVPCPKTYATRSGSVLEPDAIRFPVIVKPVDGAAAIGITICWNEEELAKACRLARERSASGEIIVEDYLIGTEITAVYTIADGKISLSLVRDRYPSLDHENVTAQFDASIAPSNFYEEYLKTVDPYVKDMLEGIGAYAGNIFFQGIAGERGIALFECGYRMNALCDYHVIERANGLNYLDMLVHYTLTGNCGDIDLSLDNPNPRELCCIFNMTAHQGTVARLEGLEETLRLPNVIYAEYLMQPGRVVKDTNSMAQSVFRAYINTKNTDELKQTIRRIQEHIQVEDESGDSMLFLPFDVDRINNTIHTENGEAV